MKKIAVGFVSAVLLVLSFQPVHAEDQRVLAIIDSAVDSSKIPSVIYEACFTDSLAMACPNKQKFMEGKGSANSPFWPTSMLNTIYHGYNVTQAALATSPDIKIVFVRVSDITSSGNGSNQPASVISAIKWVSDNAAKYSIDAVSVSLSSITANNILLCTTNTTLINSVVSLNQQNIPVFAATGNDKSLDKVGFPACTPGIIGVGAYSPELKILETATNRGPGIDVVAQNAINIVRYNGTVVSFSATSAATPIAAALYVQQIKYSTCSLFINSFAKVLGIYPYISRQ